MQHSESNSVKQSKKAAAGFFYYQVAISAFQPSPAKEHTVAVFLNIYITFYVGRLISLIAN